MNGEESARGTKMKGYPVKLQLTNIGSRARSWREKGLSHKQGYKKL
jgi:hypothetical protein